MPWRIRCGSAPPDSPVPAPGGSAGRRSQRTAARPAGHPRPRPAAFAADVVPRLPGPGNRSLRRRLLPERRYRRTQRRRQHQLRRPRRRRHYHLWLPGRPVRCGERADRTPGSDGGGGDRQARPGAHRTGQGLRRALRRPPADAGTGGRTAAIRAPAPVGARLPAGDRVPRGTAEDPSGKIQRFLLRNQEIARQREAAPQAAAAN